MNRDRVAQALRAHTDELRARGVTYLALFGFIARGDARPDSDTDVVVDIARGRKFSLIDHASLRVLLCDILGGDIDVVVRRHLSSGFRERMEAESLPVL